MGVTAMPEAMVGRRSGRRNVRMAAMGNVMVVWFG